MIQFYHLKVIFSLLGILLSSVSWSQYQVEKLNRGIVAVRAGTNNFVSWRWLGTEDNITFNLYRNGAKVNATPLNVTNYTDNGAPSTATYYVRAVVAGVEQPQSETASVWVQNYLQIPLQIPAGGTTPSGEAYSYTANDCSIGDVDGDGVHEIFVKWDPSNAKDNSQSGYTGNVYIDCYKLNGTRMWRIDLGRNIRAGAHYTQFMVYDFDSDGKAELACKTADGTRDAAGTYVGSSSADHRNSGGYILAGPEYLTMFNGATGRIMATTNYIPARGTVSSWGDNYGNRVDRFLAGVAYLDGKKPSLISCRGYYTRTVVVAWDWVNGAFARRWTFDSNVSGGSGQGDHSLSIADVDIDGKQEIIYGAMVIDDNGTILYNTGHGHGDALHVSDFDPTIPGLEVFNIQERDDSEDCYLYSPSQKRVLWQKGTTGGEGPGRGVAANITEQFAGAECWIAGGQVSGAPFRVNGTSMGTAQPSSVNFLCWWDGDLARELSNGTTIDKYPSGRLLTASGCSSNNGSKSTPSLMGDLLGDWREELMVRSSTNNFLRIYTTTTPSPHKVRTLLHDAQYRVALAWQNTAYNQPPHPSFYLGDGVALPGKPNIVIVGNPDPVNQAPTVSLTAPANNASFTEPASVTITATATDADGTVSSVSFYNGATLLGTDATSPYSFTWSNVAAGSYTITARATDNDGAVSTSAASTVQVNPVVVNVPPTVSLTAPANNASFTAPATISITATAADSDGTISSVSFYNGTTLLGTDASSPYSFTWNNVAAGTYTITARATDNLGATTTSSAVSVNVTDIQTPGVTIQAELACSADGVMNESINAGFSGTGYVNLNNVTGTAVSWKINSTTAQTVSVTFKYANASTANRNMSLSVNGAVAVANIDFLSTAAWTTWNTVTVQTALAAGDNTFTLTSLTAQGAPNLDELTFNALNISMAACSVTQPNQAPVVSISSPVSNASYLAPATISINASATDADGTLSKVDFYNGTTLLGTDATAPYSFNWTNVPAGSYFISARATDNEGSQTTSSVISVVVNPVVTSIGEILGADCGAVNSNITYEVNSSLRAGATSYAWWMNGYSQGVTQVAGAPFRANVATGAHFTGGQVCVGINYNIAPFYATYCKTVSACSSGAIAPPEATVGPNPTEGSFTLTVLDAVESVRVTDMNGVVVYSSGKIEEGATVEFGSSFSPGLYNVTIVYSSGRVETKRIQKL